MRNSRDVKDKSITLEAFKYRAHVAYYDGRVVDCGLHESLKAAQKVLRKYPRDVWDGYDKNDFRYREVDEYVRKGPQSIKTTHRKQEPLHVFGRAFESPCTRRDREKG